MGRGVTSCENEVLGSVRFFLNTVHPQVHGHYVLTSLPTPVSQYQAAARSGQSGWVPSRLRSQHFCQLIRTYGFVSCLSLLKDTLFHRCYRSVDFELTRPSTGVLSLRQVTASSNLGALDSTSRRLGPFSAAKSPTESRRMTNYVALKDTSLQCEARSVTLVSLSWGRALWAA